MPRTALPRSAGLLFALAAAPLSAQQVADTAYRAPLTSPAFAGDGPTVCVDQGHHNFHTIGERYGPFATVLRQDGFRVRAYAGGMRADSLAACDVLVIANALPAEGDIDAFSGGEVRAIRRWVADGGALFLIADHMPFGAASRALAAALGVTFADGFAVAPHAGYAGLDRALGTPTIFRAADGTLDTHEVTAGVDSVRSFMGQAIRLPRGAVALLRLPEGHVLLSPAEPWQFTADTPRRDVGGWSQGGLLEVGRGRVAVFGEAAMFTAQRAGAAATPAGMNAPGAEQNWRLLVQVMRWLAISPAGTGLGSP